jgi:D-aspartate ligase
MTERPTALLTMAEYYGTLAAVRALGRAGIDVQVADSSRMAPARWSRHVARAPVCPDPETASDAFIEWLVALGTRAPGMVVLPTSDGLEWLLAANRERLAPLFHLAIPSLAAVYSVLNKWRLREACLAAGLDTPWTALPENDDALDRLAREAAFPLVVKPQTQVGLWPHQKGRVVHSASELRSLYGDLCNSTRVHPTLLAIDPRAARPLLQAFASSAAEGIYSLSGFVHRERGIFVAQASRKVLQRPRLLGTGLCFEEADVMPDLAAGVERLCQTVGLDGVFEVEFVEADGRFQVIDFNPRFFGQMAFDVDRGVNLPLLAYLAAVGDWSGLARAAETARVAAARRTGRAFCNRVQLRSHLLLRRLARSAPAGESARWNGWLGRHAGKVTDPCLDGRDWAPGLVEILREATATLRHPRAAWRAARRE